MKPKKGQMELDGKVAKVKKVTKQAKPEKVEVKVKKVSMSDRIAAWHLVESKTPHVQDAKWVTWAKSYQQQNPVQQTTAQLL